MRTNPENSLILSILILKITWRQPFPSRPLKWTLQRDFAKLRRTI